MHSEAAVKESGRFCWQTADSSARFSALDLKKLFIYKPKQNYYYFFLSVFQSIRPVLQQCISHFHVFTASHYWTAGDRVHRNTFWEIQRQTLQIRADCDEWRRWGSWGDREMCPAGTYAAGFSLKVRTELITVVWGLFNAWKCKLVTEGWRFKSIQMKVNLLKSTTWAGAVSLEIPGTESLTATPVFF